MRIFRNTDPTADSATELKYRLRVSLVWPSRDRVGGNTADVTGATDGSGHRAARRLINSSRDGVSADLIRAPSATARGPL